MYRRGLDGKLKGSECDSINLRRAALAHGKLSRNAVTLTETQPTLLQIAVS